MPAMREEQARSPERFVPMIRPDHVWFFFTVVLSLALAMSIPPRKADLQSQANAHSGTPEQSILR